MWRKIDFNHKTCLSMDTGFTYSLLLWLVPHAALQSLASVTQPPLIKYNDGQVWRTTLQNEKDQDFLQALDDGKDISMWKIDRNAAEFLVMPEDLTKIQNVLRTKNLTHEVIMKNVQENIDSHHAKTPEWNETTLRLGHRLSFDSYPTFTVIEEYMKQLSASHPKKCTLSTIGHSYQDRPILMMKVSNGNANNKAFVVVAGMHAREWISITSALYILNEIVTKYDTQPAYVTNKDWYFIPVTNPDGFTYTHSVDRLWRKNRVQYGRCFGTDINRNFGKFWELKGTTEHKPCSSIFCGNHPYSEPETKALRDFLQKVIKKSSAFLDLHSYGQLILYPWAGSGDHSVNSRSLDATAHGMSKSIYKTSRSQYTYGNAYDKMYPASGSAIDWVYSLGAEYVYAIETRDTGAEGFLVGEDSIEEAGKEMYSAAKYISEVMGPESS